MVGGPLCESGDIFTQEGGYVRFKRTARRHECRLYRTENAAAYGFVMASNYNSKTRAAEVFIENGEAKLIRQREQSEDLIRGEIIPE